MDKPSLVRVYVGGLQSETDARSLRPQADGSVLQAWKAGPETVALHRQLAATMIYVTHDQVEAMTMGDRIVVMKDGHVQQVDKPLSLYDHPVNKFVAGFIGSPAMNFVPGRMQDGRLELPFITFDLPGKRVNTLSRSLVVWFERKVIADMQTRVGPMRAGPWGILQTVADAFRRGVRPAFRAIHGPGRRASLPPYPFGGERGRDRPGDRCSYGASSHGK